jgi:arylsulfatase A-like enzyme
MPPMPHSALRRVLLCAAALLAAPLAAAPARPNIIFILADDLGYGDPGVFFQNARRAAGNRAAQFTPQLDRLAAEGAQLTHHYAAAPVCAPSRASLLSGVHQGHANVRDNQFDKAIADNHTLATVLRSAGYATAAIGKWGLQGRAEGATPNWPAHPLNRGFDSYFGYIRHVDGHEHYPKEAPYQKISRARRAANKNAPVGEERDDTRAGVTGVEVWDNRTEISAQLDGCYTADLFTARAKKWIVEQKKSAPAQPFFLYLAFDTPHAILQLPTQAYPAGGGLKGGLQWLGQPGHMINTASPKIDSWTHPDYATATYDHDGDPATPDQPWPDVYRRYATSVRRIDDAVGDLVQLLRDLGVDENTLIVFSSDNGPSIESYLPEKITPEFFASFGPFDGIKRDLWEGGTRVPTIARWPARIPAGRVVSAPSAHWDWLPTFAEIAGVPAPARADGISLVPALTSNAPNSTRDHAPLYFEYQQAGRTPTFAGFEPAHRNRQRNQMQAVRLGDYVGVRYDIKSANDDFEIYHVTADPKETKNLARDPAQAPLQQQLKDLALQSRRPDASAPRPYDREPVPADHTDPAKLVPGLTWQSTAGKFPWVPAPQGLAATARGIVADLAVSRLSPSEPGATVFSGYLMVPTEGDYTFTLRTDVGALLRLHDATVIDADFGYTSGTARTATIRLAAGPHAILLTTLHRAGSTPALAVEWSGPGIASQPIPAQALRHLPPAAVTSRP